MTALRLSICVVALVSLQGCGERQKGPPPRVAATNSLLACAAREFLGPGAPVLQLAGPGMCPGHFDVRPSQINALRHCSVLLRMDIQQSLDRKLEAAVDEGLRIAEVRVSGGLCLPASYIEVCGAAARALVEAGLLDRSEADDRLARIQQRMGRLTDLCRQRVEPLADLPVLSSVHQESFCRWLGLRPVATFRGSDTAGSSELAEAYDVAREAGARLVVANLPEGRRAADFLAERLKGRVVVFENFPAGNAGIESFEALVTGNVTRLIEAAQP